MVNDYYVTKIIFFAFQAIKGCTIFKVKRLQHEDKLAIMFEDLQKISDEAKEPSG